MEDKTIHSKIDQYLELFDKLKARTGDERSALTILQEVNKDIRMAQIRAERENGNGNGSSADGEATNRQRAYLKRLGVEMPSGLTKKQASELIDEALGKESDKDSSKVMPENVILPWYSVAWSRGMPGTVW